VRLERAGRGGKDVTVIEQLGLNSTQMAAWLKALKSALGCGGVLEDGAIVLQGDHRKRLPEILTKRGVRKVTTG
jgi:translation initiation factor 1